MKFLRPIRPHPATSPTVDPKPKIASISDCLAAKVRAGAEHGLCRGIEMLSARTIIKAVAIAAVSITTASIDLAKKPVPFIPHPDGYRNRTIMLASISSTT